MINDEDIKKLVIEPAIASHMARDRQSTHVTQIVNTCNTMISHSHELHISQGMWGSRLEKKPNEN